MDKILLRKLALETILQILKITDSQIKKYEELGDISAVEILNRDVITKYETLYLTLLETDFENLPEEELITIDKTLEDIRTQHNLTKDFLLAEIKVREDLSGDSGSTVVEKLYRYQLSKLLEKKQILTDKLKAVLDKEWELENKLKDTIQEEDQFDIIYELSPIREEFRALEQKLNDLENLVSSLKRKINSKWSYEIYGTMSKENLMEIYKENFDLGE
ncbi:MAG: hypothetical protein ACRC1R_05975 [Cetobacterium sp.]|uniref:hypothetical protein n=1 Tax=Cetobacterium sp. TaxID=2071632 RepID=UPI003F2E455F